jgi:hypothetical protein
LSEAARDGFPKKENKSSNKKEAWRRRELWRREDIMKI